jgi:hypothetical protein
VFLFLALTGWSTQRYEVDFLPMFVLCALAAGGALRHIFAQALLLLLVIGGVIVNLAIAVGGPVDEMIQRRPDRYVRLSRLLTPTASHTLRLNPPFSFVCPIDQGPAGQMILSLGSPIYRYELLHDGTSLISRRFGSEVRYPVAGMREVAVSFDPATGEVIVSEHSPEHNEEWLRHRLGSLTAAPVELRAACGGRAQ